MKIRLLYLSTANKSKVHFGIDHLNLTTDNWFNLKKTWFELQADFLCFAGSRNSSSLSHICSCSEPTAVVMVLQWIATDPKSACLHYMAVAF